MIGTILTFIGLLLTIVFGIYSIWTYRKSKKGVCLEFKNVQCYSLFRDDVTRLNIEIIYNKISVSNTLILFKGKLINTGQFDVDKNRIFDPLKVNITKNFEWLEVRPTSTPGNSTSTIKILTSNQIQIDWDLLKIGEYIEFEALVVDNSSNKEESTIVFYNGITFECRITDLNNVVKEDMFPNSASDNFFDKLFNLLPYFLMIFGIYILISEYYGYIEFTPKVINIEYKVDNGKSKRVVIIQPIDGNNIQIRDVNSDEKSRVSVDNFNQTYEIEKIERLHRLEFDRVINLIFGYLLISVGILRMIFYLVSKILKKASKEKLKLKDKTINELNTSD